MPATVLDLLAHLRDDPKLAPLWGALDELSGRVQTSNQQNIANVGEARAALPPSLSPLPSLRHAPSAHIPHGSPKGWGSSVPFSSAHGKSSGSSTKIELAVLPIPPAESWKRLGSPEGANDWGALQSAVNDACTQFSSAAAKVAWKKWALTRDNVGVVVAVAWWVVAHVFCPDHHMSACVQEHAFKHFSSRYVGDVLTWGGASKDLYQDLWLSVVSAAAVSLLREAYPKSSHKLDAGLVAFVTAALQRWASGPMPSDMHPSAGALVGEAPPAALTRVRGVLDAQAAAAKEAQRLAAAAAARRSLVGANPAMPGPLLDSLGVPLPGSSQGAITRRVNLSLGTHSLGSADGTVGGAASASGNMGHGQHWEEQPVSVGLLAGHAVGATATGTAGSAAAGVQSRPRRTVLVAAGTAMEGGEGIDGSEVLGAAHCNVHASMQAPHALPRPAAGASSAALRTPESIAAVASGAAPGPTLRSVHASVAAAASAGGDVDIAVARSTPGSPRDTKHSSEGSAEPHPYSHSHVVSPMRPGSLKPGAATSGTVKVHPQSAPPAAGFTTDAAPFRPHARAASQAGAAGPMPPGAAAFLTTATSPVMAHLFEAYSLGMPAAGDGAIPGLRHAKLGTGQRSRRQPLDMDATASILSPSGTAANSGRGAERQTGRGAGGAGRKSERSRGVQTQDWGEEEEEGEGMSYAAMARASTQRAADARKRYEAAKKQARREIAEFKRTGVLPGESAPVPLAARAKELSDRLSGWVENDVDRLQKGQPPATTHMVPTNRLGRDPASTAPVGQLLAGWRQGVSAHGATKSDRTAAGSATEAVLLAGGGASMGATAPGIGVDVGASPGYTAMTAAAMAGAGRASASFLSAAATVQKSAGAAGAGAGAGVSTRIMAPWSKMRSVESHIRGALSQARHSSNDVAARAHRVCNDLDTLALKDGAVGKDGRWKPAPLEYARGGLDIRLKQEVRKAMRAVDMELYKGS